MDSATSAPDSLTRGRVPADRILRAAIEGILLLMVFAAPWGLGGTHPKFLLALNVCTGLVLVIWAARAIVTFSLPFRTDSVLFAVCGLALLTALQLLPIPTSALGVVSQNTVETNVRLRPEIGEHLPGEAEVTNPRPTSFPVSLSPPDTWDFLSQLFPLALLYAAARSNLSGTGPLVRLAWVCA